MTTPSEPPAPSGGPASTRPGRKLGPVADNVGSAHRAWLDPMRSAYLSSGLTLNELSTRVRFAKSKISEMLRGVGLYPRLEIVLRLATELDMPNWPLYRLWKQAALETHKSSDWISGCTNRTAVKTTHIAPPLDHSALRQLMEKDYELYAQTFLDDDQRDIAVRDAFDRLWLSWNEALASHDIRRYAWNVLRTTVMARTPHRDGRPELGDAAFDTVILQSLAEPADCAHQLTETLELFAAISRLPDRQLDVMVLRRLRGFTPEQVSSLLGASLATIRSDERHATRFLDSVIPPPSTEGITP
ncbi:sigma-70 family RNA polymerase sigma factor [Streptomyces sp. NPDC019224]|uniref:sigma-70 family RNA polymerase sigma factor n=1 Tax=Streptomyces sp. NPDC019224 TaxID=3154484 RepID=UPI0033F6DCA7